MDIVMDTPNDRRREPGVLEVRPRQDDPASHTSVGRPEFPAQWDDDEFAPTIVRGRE